MATEILEILLRVNLAAAAAVAVVLMLRGPLRRAAGSRIAYALWLAVPVAVGGSLVPARKIVAALPVSAIDAPSLGERAGVIAGSGGLPAAGPAIPFDWTGVAIALWAAGAVAGVAWLVWRQRRFLALVGGRSRKGGGLQSLAAGVGPAVVGAIAPKILLPVDFDDRFSPKERDVVLAHEEFHLRQGHAQTNALMLISQCVNWFNPALHLAARAIRLDQEMACDEAVVARFPNAKRTYAEAMLKTQLTPDLVLGCYWPAKGSALRQRLSLLKAPRPSRKAAVGGAASTLALSLAAGVAAWAAQPPTTVFQPAPASPAPATALQAKATPPAEAAMPAPQAAPAIRNPLQEAETIAFSTEETQGIVETAEQGREFAEIPFASADAPRQLQAARASLLEEVEKTRRRYGRLSGAASPARADQKREAAAEVRAAELALEMFDDELEKFGGLERLVQISSTASATATSAYATASASASASAYADRYGRFQRDARQPARDPAVIEPGFRIHVNTKLTLPNGRQIGGDGFFTKNGSTQAQDGGYVGDPRYSIASSIRQVGDAVEVRPKVMLDGRLIATGRAVIPSGETVTFTLDNGMAVTTKATIRRLSTPKRCCQT